MGRGKGYYNKDSERTRQEKRQLQRKHKNLTAVRLKEKIIREDVREEILNDYAKLFENHYNSCYSGFAKRTLVRNCYDTYLNSKASVPHSLKKCRYAEFKFLIRISPQSMLPPASVHTLIVYRK